MPAATEPWSVKDLLFARLAGRRGRAPDDTLKALYERPGSLPFGQRLVKEKVLKASEYLQVLQALERPILACPHCAEPVSPQDIDANERRCPACGEPLDGPRLLAGLSDALLDDLVEGPVTALEEGRDGSRPGDPAARGRVLGRYEVLDVIGRGAMGVVYRARQLDLGRIVALKVLRAGVDATETQIRRFLREARAAALLTHPHIVPIHDVGVEEGVHFFSMDLIEGPTLQERIEKGEPLTFRQTARLVATLARTLGYAHRKGVVHRDMKPGNILLGKDGVPRITDFGLAKTRAVEALVTRSGVAIGTPLYMSPEQARGDLRAIDGRSDLFGLGAILYQLLTGRVPFEGTSHIEIYNRIVSTDPLPPRAVEPHVPRDLNTICLKALEKRRGDRYATGVELADDLERWLRKEPIRARPLPILERVFRAVRRHQSIATAAVIGALIAVTAWATALAVIERRDRGAEADEAARASIARDGLVHAARAALAEGAPAEALRHAQHLEARFPGSDEAGAVRLVRGAALVALGRAEEAARVFASAFREEPSDARRAEALLGLARALAASGAPERAERALERLTARYPDTTAARRARIELAASLARSGRTEDAARLLQEVEVGRLASEDRERAYRLSAHLRRFGSPRILGGADALTAADLDGDGRPELVCARGGRLSIYAAPGGALRAIAEADLGPLVRIDRLVAADVRGDGRDELVAAGRDEVYESALLIVSVQLAGAALPAAPEMAAPVARAEVRVLHRARTDGPLARGGLAAGDLDGDGRAEIALAVGAGSRGEVRLFRVAREQLRAEPLAAVRMGSEPGSVAVVDPDGDGRAELLVGATGPGGADVRVYALRGDEPERTLRAGVGPVTAALGARLGPEPSHRLVVGTSRGEAAGEEDGGLVALETGDGGASPAWRDSMPDLPGPLAVLDLESGDLFASRTRALVALVARSPARRLVRILAAPGAAAPSDEDVVTITLPEGAGEHLVLADLDLDGDDELIVGGPGEVRVFGLREEAR